AEAAAQEQLLVLAVEQEDLHRARARLLERVAAAFAFARYRAQPGEAFIKPGGGGAFSIAPCLVRRTLLLTEDAVFLQGQLVKRVAVRQVLGEGSLQAHEREGASAGRGSASTSSF